VRLYVAIVIVLLVVIATAVSLMAKPIDAPLVIDHQSPGVWPTYAATPASMYICHVRPVRDIPSEERAGKVVQT
jgi:hypothetical protein